VIVADTPRETAFRMLEAELWPIPVYSAGETIPTRDGPRIATGKEPIGKEWGKNRNTRESLTQAFRVHPTAAVGIALGPGRGPDGSWLIDVEGDGPEAEESRTRLFGGECFETFGWTSTRGHHQLLTGDPELITKLLEPLGGFEGKGTNKGVYLLPAYRGLEIRFGGFKLDGTTVKQLQSVFPPSPGTDGKPREWNRIETIANAPESLYEALRRSGEPPATGRAAAPPWVVQASNGSTSQAAFVQSVIDREVEKVATAAEGTRNNALNAAAFNVGTLLGTGLINRGQVEFRLESAAEHAGLSAGEARATIRSGLDAGAKNPRIVPERNGYYPPTSTADGPSTTVGSSTTVGPSSHDETPLHLTDLGNAQRMVQFGGKDIRYSHPWGKWLVWDRTRWRIDDTAEVRRIAKRTVCRIYAEAAAVEDDAQRKEIARHARSSEGKERIKAMIELATAEESIPVRPAELDTHPMLLNCRNGTLDLTTGELRPHSREDLITQLCPLEYDPAAECPVWLATLHKVFDSLQDLIHYFQKLCGYCLSGSVAEKILAILHGKGSNGKSTIVNTLLALLGQDYAAKAPPNILMVKRNEQHPTELATLRGKRLVVAAESDEGARLNEALVKEMTGSDPITARRMREDFSSFDPTHKVILCTNHQPQVRGTDHAIWRRVRAIPFGVVIPDSEQDKTLPHKLAGELPGILAWAVRGCLGWQEDGLEPPVEVLEATEECRQRQDVLGTFLKEECQRVKGGEVRASELYARYKDWAERTNTHAISGRSDKR
jgi:P4 family phage/plasmid primase-like protien